MIEGLKVAFSPETTEKACENLRNAMESGRLIYDTWIPKLEDMVKAISEAPFAAAFASDTCAQTCLWETIKVKNKSVVVSGNMFASPVFALQRLGATIIWCDVECDGQISLSHLTQILETPSLMPVVGVLVSSPGGALPTTISNLRELSRAHDFFLVEDAAHSLGSRRGDWTSGNWADFTVFSFMATKTGGFGTGGMLVGFSDEIIKDAETLSRYGRRQRFGSSSPTEKGYSYRMSEVTAAVGCAVLEYLPIALEKKRELAHVYNTKVPSRYRKFDYGLSNFYKYPIELPESVTRHTFAELLLNNDVQLSSNFVNSPTYHQPTLKTKYRDVSLAGCERFCERHVCLPMHEWLSVSDVETVCQQLENLA